jgi:hypothetical protein
MRGVEECGCQALDTSIWSDHYGGLGWGRGRHECYFWSLERWLFECYQKSEAQGERLMFVKFSQSFYVLRSDTSNQVLSPRITIKTLLPS